MATTTKQPRSVFACGECGYESPKWLGRCPDCASWNSFAEHAVSRATRVSNGPSPMAAPIELSRLSADDEPRMALGIAEFDRVLGGGVVPGSLVLVGGDPGIGKSTLLLQVAAAVAGGGAVAAGDRSLPRASYENLRTSGRRGRATVDVRLKPDPQNARTATLEPRNGSSDGRRVVYLSGEESARQVKMRAERLGFEGAGLFLLSETNLDAALREAESLSPALLVVDSIQTVHSEAAPQAPGRIAQLRQCTMDLMRWSKGSGVPVFIVGHVTKDGDIAGPRLLEHIVDAVLYLEGERFSNYRLLRGVKNRFGSVDEIGVFEMTAEGLQGVENPSAAFIAERASDAVGSVVLPTLEGSRPLLVEVQALTSASVTPAPRRVANGLDFNRLLLVSAVLGRRSGINVGSQDIMASVVGGLRVYEPAADLALAIVSSHRDGSVPSDLIALGEIGLSGELRSVSHLERRLSEAARLGFRRCLLPGASLRGGNPKADIQALPAATVREALRLALG